MKTDNQDKLEGRPGHRKIKDVPAPSRKIPPPPKSLDAVGKRFYYDLVRLCGDEMKVLAITDTKALEMLSDAYSEYRAIKNLIPNMDDKYYVSKREITTKLHEDGSETITESTIIKKHPAVSDMQNAWGRIMQALTRFGMTPYDRQKVGPMLESGTDNKPTRKDELKEKRIKIQEKAKKMAEDGGHIKEVANVK